MNLYNPHTNKLHSAKFLCEAGLYMTAAIAYADGEEPACAEPCRNCNTLRRIALGRRGVAPTTSGPVIGKASTSNPQPPAL